MHTLHRKPHSLQKQKVVMGSSPDRVWTWRMASGREREAKMAHEQCQCQWQAHLVVRDVGFAALLALDVRGERAAREGHARFVERLAPHIFDLPAHLLRCQLLRAEPNRVLTVCMYGYVWVSQLDISVITTLYPRDFKVLIRDFS